ncbi:hypothetical protein SUGI_0693610 [Cryptomeria japonica]|nr:hypothetical protein SUGI_0693610 [Cryptomeria japonica]
MSSVSSGELEPPDLFLVCGGRVEGEGHGAGSLKDAVGKDALVDNTFLFLKIVGGSSDPHVVPPSPTTLVVNVSGDAIHPTVSEITSSLPISSVLSPEVNVATGPCVVGRDTSASLGPLKDLFCGVLLPPRGRVSIEI